MPADALPVAFRAGRIPGAGEGLPALPAGPYVLLADISEYQPEIDDACYLRDFSPAIIIRAAYGTREDHAWYGGQRRSQLLAGGARFVGIYQYVTAAENPASQARALVQILGGRLNRGEKLIADIEEGSTCQETWQEWAHVIRTELGASPWLYSGMYFSAHAEMAPDWIAAYQAAEPSVPHVLWQFTDSYAVPGIGICDCSLFRGTISQLAALAWGGSPAPPETEDQMIIIPAGNTGPDVGVSFNGAGAYKTIGFLADPGRIGAASIQVRVAQHIGGTPGSWSVSTVTMTPAAPKQVLTLAAGVDGVSFRRLDNAPADLYPNFA